jgi:hypothetical protein
MKLFHDPNSQYLNKDTSVWNKHMMWLGGAVKPRWYSSVLATAGKHILNIISKR